MSVHRPTARVDAKDLTKNQKPTTVTRPETTDDDEEAPKPQHTKKGGKSQKKDTHPDDDA